MGRERRGGGGLIRLYSTHNPSLVMSSPLRKVSGNALHFKMADDMSTKLLVRHLPSQLSVHEKTDLLKHFGAKEVICMERRGKLVSVK